MGGESLDSFQPLPDGPARLPERFNRADGKNIACAYFSDIINL
jgi:hypothetical protein